MAFRLPGQLPWDAIAGPLSQADDALARLDERLRASPLREGWIARTDFAEAVAALWNRGELVHMEDLILRDARMDVRASTHELTQAHAVLRARRRALRTDPALLLTYRGAGELIGRTKHGDPSAFSVGQSPEGAGDAGHGTRADSGMTEHRAGDFSWPEDVDDIFAFQDALADEEIDPEFDTPPMNDVEVMTAERALSSAQQLLDRLGRTPYPRDHSAPDSLGLTPDLEQEFELFAEWRSVLPTVSHQPPLIASAILMEAWRVIDPIPRQSWVGAILVGAVLRQQGRVVTHVPILHIGLRAIREIRHFPVDLAGRLVRWLGAFEAAAREGLREHDRLVLARQLLERTLKGRRSTSKLPKVIDLLIAKPLVTVPLIARELSVSPQAAQGLVAMLSTSIRERTGRTRYRAWSI